MKANMRSTVALTLAALAFAEALAHNTASNEYHVTEVDTQTVDCTDEIPLPELTVRTSYFTHVHQPTHYTLPSEFTLPYPTTAIEESTSHLVVHYSTGGQQVTSVASNVEEQPTVSSAVSTSTREEPIVSMAPPFTSTQVRSTFVTVPASSDSVTAIVTSSSAISHSEVPTKTVHVTIPEHASTTEAVVPPIANTETPLINPIRLSHTPSDTPTTTSITLTTTDRRVSVGASPVHSEASEAIIPIPPVTQGVPPVVSSHVATSISNTVKDLTTTTKTITHSNTAVVTLTVILNPTRTSVAPLDSVEDCFSTVYLTVYSPSSSPAPVATAPVAPPAIAHNTTVVVATGVPHPNINTTAVTNTTTAQSTIPIHGAAPTLSGAPGLMLAFCGLICYLI